MAIFGRLPAGDGAGTEPVIRITGIAKLEEIVSASPLGGQISVTASL
jgi:hypothetical protein